MTFINLCIEQGSDKDIELEAILVEALGNLDFTELEDMLDDKALGDLDNKYNIEVKEKIETKPNVATNLTHSNLELGTIIMKSLHQNAN